MQRVCYQITNKNGQRSLIKAFVSLLSVQLKKDEGKKKFKIGRRYTN